MGGRRVVQGGRLKAGPSEAAETSRKKTTTTTSMGAPLNQPHFGLKWAGGRRWGDFFPGGWWVVGADCLTTMKAKHCPGQKLPGPLRSTPKSHVLVCVCQQACPNFFSFSFTLFFSTFYAFNFFLSLHSSVSFFFGRCFVGQFFYGPVACYNFLTAWSLVSRSYSLGAPVAGLGTFDAGHWAAGTLDCWDVGETVAAVTGHSSGQINAIVYYLPFRFFPQMAHSFEP